MDDYEPGSIRTYLMQMGDIPLLSRQSELAIARQIERTRNRLRRGILTSDYVLHMARSAFEEILAGRVRLDHIVEMSSNNAPQKRHVLRLLQTNLRTLHHLLEQDVQDFALTRRRARGPRASGLPTGGSVRGGGAARLVEEVGVRMQRIQTRLTALKQISERMNSLVEQLAEIRRRAGLAPAAGRTSQGTAPPHGSHAGNPRSAQPPAGAVGRAGQVL